MVPKKKGEYQAGLCWCWEKFIAGAFYLHEGSGETCKTATDKLPEGRQAELSRSETFPPVLPVRTKDGGNGIFIKERLAGKDIPVSGSIFITPCNGNLDRERDLGIRDDLREQDGMGMAAGVTEDPGDPEYEDRIPLPELAGIATVPDEAAGMAAGTGNQIQIERINGIIVKFLRNRVAIFCLNGYHSSVWRRAMRGYEGRDLAGQS